MNRTGTYVAFDGNGEYDPTKSDFRYYSTLQAWDKNSHMDFNFVNSHEKTYSVRDSSSITTLRKRILERLSSSKNMLIILSKDTRKTGSQLSYEIEKAVDFYKLPLIIAYTNCDRIVGKNDIMTLSNRWPIALKQRLENNSAKAIHIPFKEKPIMKSISKFYVNGDCLTSSYTWYTKETYTSWNL